MLLLYVSQLLFCSQPLQHITVHKNGGFLGLTMSTTRPNHIIGVVDGSPAAVAGLAARDVIIDINGMNVTGWNAIQLETEWNRYDTIQMVVRRPKVSRSTAKNTLAPKSALLQVAG